MQSYFLKWSIMRSSFKLLGKLPIIRCLVSRTIFPPTPSCVVAWVGAGWIGCTKVMGDEVKVVQTNETEIKEER